jgi:AraC-like DNA-binding protein
MRAHFSTDDLPPRDREQFWLDVVFTHVMKITPVDRPDPAAFRAELDLHVVGRFTQFRYQTSHRIGRRTRADVSRDSSGRFQLRRVAREQIYTASSTRATGAEIRLGPRDFCVTSTGWPYQSSMKDGTSGSGLLIPREVLSPLLAGGRLTRPILVPAGSPLGSLMGAAFEAATAQLPRLSPELGDAVLRNLCGLVALACGASEQGRSGGRDSMRTARLEAAKRHIDQHLAEPGLMPASTAAALGISLRHLHLLFEPTGTSFAQYVAQRRLLQCRAALTSPTGTGRSVADIAFGWGFNSLATFYRAFEREFGSSPTALRATGAVPHG